MKPTERTTRGIREVLFQALDDYRAGNIKAADVSAIAKTVNAILATVNTDLNAARTMNFLKNQGHDKVDLNLLLCEEVSIENPEVDVENDLENSDSDDSGYIHKGSRY